MATIGGDCLQLSLRISRISIGRPATGPRSWNRLGRDARVRAVYYAWRTDHGLDQHRAPTVAFRAAVLRDADCDLARLGRLVREDLKCGFDWLPQFLLARFRLLSLDAVTGVSRGLVIEAPTDVDGLPRGRRVKHDGEHVRRDVEWFYRHKLKNPSDTIASLAREYADVAQRGTDARSVIQNGMKRAEHFLSAIYIPLTPPN